MYGGKFQNSMNIFIINHIVFIYINLVGNEIKII